MPTLTRTHPAVAAALKFQAALRARAAAAMRGRARRRLERRNRRALAALDDRTLRDLGFDRGEIPSVAAELAGAADLTRVRR